MFKFLIAVFLCVVTFSYVSAQEEVMSFTMDDGAKGLRKKDGFSFSNSRTNELAIVLTDRKTSFAYLFDASFTKQSSLEFDPLKKKYSQVLGYKVQDKKYTVLASNSSHKKFAIMTIDFESKNAITAEIELTYKDEKFVETVQYDNRLFLISATKDNVFVLREMGSDLKFTMVKEFAISAENGTQDLLKYSLANGLFGGVQSEFTKVDNRVPNAIERTANNDKLYQQDELIYLTIEDEDEGYTLLHVIDVEKLTLESYEYAYPKGKLGDFRAYNSFIIDNHIIQLGSSRLEMLVQVKDFEGMIIKEYYLEKDKPIDIKNSPIIQKGQTAVPFVNRRELEETSKYLRKVSSGHLGITAYRNGENYAVTLGGYKEIQSSGGMMMGGGTTTVISTGSGAVLVSYNPTYSSYYSYSSTKSTYFNTTFDANFDYVKKEKEEAHIFERIETLKKDIKYDTAEDVFFHQDILYFGYYNMDEKKYHLIKMD